MIKVKIAVIPDGAMLIVHLVTKNNHEYLSSTNITEEKLRNKDPYDEDVCDYDAPPFNMEGYGSLVGNKYTSCETPSGFRGHLSLFDNIIQNAQAAIIMGLPPKNYEHMYDTLNELILFSCVGCYNNYKLVVSLLKKKNIPILEIAYPTTRDDLINMFDRINRFLQDLHKKEVDCSIINEDNLNIDLKVNKEKISVNDFNKILDEINLE